MLIRNKNGTELEYNTTTYMMNDDIREDLHSKIAKMVWLFNNKQV